MTLKLITAASVLPVSLAEAKLACRFDAADLDADITDMIRDAARLVSHETGQSLTPETWELSLDCFPESFELTRGPVASITIVTYVDTAGVTQTLSSTAYAIDAANLYGPAYLVPAYGTTWPTARDEINAVKVRYVAGYPDAASVPSHLRRQVKIVVAQLLDDPQAMAKRLSGIDKVYFL